MSEIVVIGMGSCGIVDRRTPVPAPCAEEPAGPLRSAAGSLQSRRGILLDMIATRAPIDSNQEVVDRFLRGIGIGRPADDVYAPDAVLDATVPGWRFQAHGAEAILHEYRRWGAEALAQMGPAAHAG